MDDVKGGKEVEYFLILFVPLRMEREVDNSSFDTGVINRHRRFSPS